MSTMRPLQLPEAEVTGSKVFVVLYHHRHGTDLWVSSTEEKALQSLAPVMLDSITEIDDEDSKKKIKFLLESEKYKEAAKAWEEYHAFSEESFEIVERVVDIG